MAISIEPGCGIIPAGAWSPPSRGEQVIRVIQRSGNWWHIQRFGLD